MLEVLLLSLLAFRANLSLQPGNTDGVEDGLEPGWPFPARDILAQESFY